MALAVLSSSYAELILGTPFADHMVLQRDRPIPVWGWTAPGAKVSVSLAGQSGTATANAQGEWIATLPALPAGGPHEMIVTGPEEVRFQNVLVGEVWVCSGQSNMVMALSETDTAAEDIAAADYPQMSVLKLNAQQAGLPEKVPQKPRPKWVPASPATASGFSAVAYSFGREIHRELGVPVGLIVGAAGSTSSEPWTPREGLALEPSLTKWHAAALEEDEKYRAALTEWTKSDKSQPQPVHPYLLPQDPQRNTGALFQGTIAQVVPFGIRGVIWYQGESNRGDSSQAYFAWMTALVRGWRAEWGQGDFPFYYVQIGALASWRPNWQIPDIWEGQTWALNLPNTGMAVILDLCGDLKNIHPRQKREVGRRLALWALAKNYGRKDLSFSGPVFRSSTVEDGKIKITFDHTFGGLRARDGKPLTWFTIAGEDRCFVPADAEIVGETIVVSSKEIPLPMAVRFAWDEAAQPNLINAAGLPAGAFRTNQPW